MPELPEPVRSLGRRGFLAGARRGRRRRRAGGVHEQHAAARRGPRPGRGAPPAAARRSPGRPVTIGFSAPAADHGWIAAIAANAQAEAAKYPDVTFAPVNPTNDITQQIAAVETLINRRVERAGDPAQRRQPADVAGHPGDAGRHPGGQPGPDLRLAAGLPDVDRRRQLRHGRERRQLHRHSGCGQRNVANPIIAEIAGIDSLPLTQQRSQGFQDALSTYGFSVGPRQAADFTAQGGQRVTANLLQAAPRLDALWNHDDDQGIGVLAAIQQANRSEFFMVGGAGSANAMRAIQADDTVLKATVTYSPTMAGSAVSLARLIAQGRGMSDLVEQEVPGVDHAGVGHGDQGERGAVPAAGLRVLNGDTVLGRRDGRLRLHGRGTLPGVADGRAGSSTCRCSPT